jgi:hypothetical protein
MQERKIRLLEDRAGTIYVDCKEGRPSVATVTVKDSSGNDLPDTAIDGDAATIDSVNTTVASWAASAPKTIILTDATGVVRGLDYRVTDAAGLTALARVIGVQSNTVYIADRLPFEMVGGETFQGVRISLEITAANLANRAIDYVAAWVYTVASEVYKIETLFDVVLSNIRNPATTTGFRAYMRELTSDWDDLLGDDFSLEMRLDAAFWELVDELETAVRHKHSEANLANAIVHWDSRCARAVYEKVLLKMAVGGFRPPDSDYMVYLDTRQESYTKAFEGWLAAIKWADWDNDRVKEAGEENRNLTTVRLRG